MGDTTPYRSRLNVWVFLLLAIGIVALAGVATLTLHELRYGDRIYEGVEVAGIPLGGLTIEEASEALRDGLTPYPGEPITLRYDDHSWLLAPSDLGVAVDAAATASAAFAFGRRGAMSGTDANMAALWQGLREDLAAQWIALDAGVAFSPTLRFDENRLALSLRRIAQEVDLPPREGTLTISGLEVGGTSGQPGRMVDQDATRAAVKTLLQSGRGGTADLVVQQRQPAVLSVDEAVAQAQALLGKSVVLFADGMDGIQRFAIDRATLRGWLSILPVPEQDGSVGLKASLDEEQVRVFVAQVAKQLSRPAFDATLDFDRENGQVVVLEPSQVGQNLDVEATVAAVKAAVFADSPPAAGTGRAALGASTVITMPLTVVQPKVDSNKIAEMGIVEQVSEGTTYFAGSTRERIQNIVNAAGKFTGKVIPPGGEFSFNKIVGDVTTANGFVDSLIILGDRTETGVGGGVCQVSTTAFRAAFWGGFPIIERYPHSYVVSWYGEPGFDASIFTPTADFRFVNDTGHYLLVKPEVDAKKGRITFYFYGTKPDRVVEASKPVITNRRPAPKSLYQEDATLAAGKIKQVDWAKEGMDVTVKRIITYADGQVKENKFVSKYKPWQAVYLYGPGTQLPEGAATQ